MSIAAPSSALAAGRKASWNPTGSADGGLPWGTLGALEVRAAALAAEMLVERDLLGIGSPPSLLLSGD